MDYNQNDTNGGYPQQPYGDAPQQPYGNAPQQPYGNAPQQPYQQTYGGAPQPQNSEKSGMAIASMVCGIVSIVICCCEYIAVPLGIVALVLGILSIKKGQGGKGMAVAGIVCACCALAFILVCEILVRSGAIDMSQYEQWEEFLKKYQDQLGQSA